MRNKEYLFFKINYICIILIIASIIILLISPTSNIALAEGTITSNWNYPSTWSKIGGDQDYKVLPFDQVLTCETAPQNANCCQSTGEENLLVSMDEIKKSGNPTMFLKRTFLKGYFENNWYLAILVDLIMDPSNNYNTGARIRSANVAIETQLSKANKVGTLIVTYWPTYFVGGYLQEAEPKNNPDITTQSVNISVGASLGQNSAINSSFSVGYQNSISRLIIYPHYLTRDDKLNGFQVKYFYYRPDEPNVVYTESASTLKYAAIYRCDADVDIYNLRVKAEGEFYYRSASANIAIARAARYEDFYIKPSTNFFKTYA